MRTTTVSAFATLSGLLPKVRTTVRLTNAFGREMGSTVRKLTIASFGNPPWSIRNVRVTLKIASTVVADTDVI